MSHSVSARLLKRSVYTGCLIFFHSDLYTSNHGITSLLLNSVVLTSPYFFFLQTFLLLLGWLKSLFGFSVRCQSHFSVPAPNLPGFCALCTMFHCLSSYLFRVSSTTYCWCSPGFIHRILSLDKSPQVTARPTMMSATSPADDSLLHLSAAWQMCASSALGIP